jgi:hypothetical protein
VGGHKSQDELLLLAKARQLDVLMLRLAVRESP